MKARKKSGWRVGKSGTVYKTKGKTKSRRKTFSSKKQALKYAKKR